MMRLFRLFHFSQDLILSKLLHPQNSNQILNIFQQHHDHFNSAHAAQALMKINIDIEYNEKQYNELIKIVEPENVDYELIIRILNNFKKLQKNGNSVEGLIDDIIKQQRLRPEQLIALFIELQKLDIEIDTVSSKILKLKSINSQDCLNILESMSNRKLHKLTTEWNIIRTILEKLTHLIDQYSFEQVAQLFKYVSKFKMHQRYPNFRLPNALYIIHKQLLNQANLLSESSLLLIIDAYKYLPFQFRQELLEIAYQKCFIIIKQDNGIMEFAIQFATLFMSIQRKKQSEDDIKMLMNLLIEQIQKSQPTEQLNYLESVSQIFIKHPGPHLNKLISTILSGVTQFHSVPYFSMKQLINQQQPIGQQLKIIKQMDYQQMNPRELQRLILIFKDQQDYTELLEQYLIQFEQLAYNCAEFIEYLDNDVYDASLKHIYDIAASQLHLSLGNQQQLESKTLTLILQSIKSSHARQQWIQYINQSKLLWNQQQMSKFIECFTLDRYNYDQIEFFIEILHSNQHLVSLTKLVLTLNLQDCFFTQLIEYSLLARRFLELIKHIFMNSKNEDFNLRNITTIAIILDCYGYRNYQLEQMVCSIATHYLKVMERVTVSDPQYLALMLKYNCLDTKQAILEYQVQANSKDLGFKAKLLSRCFDVVESSNPTLEAEGTQLSKQLLTYVQSESVQTAIVGIVCLLGMPVRFFKPYIDILIAKLREITPLLSDRAYYSVVANIKPEFYTDKQVTQSVTKLLVHLFPSKVRPLQFSQVLEIMNIFSKFKVNDDKLFKTFIAIFRTLDREGRTSAEMRVKTLSIFSQFGKINSEFFHYNLSIIAKNPINYYSHLSEIISSVFMLGLNDKHTQDTIHKILDGLFNVSDKSIPYILTYFAISDYSIGWMDTQITTYNHQFTLPSMNLVALYFNNAYPNSQIAKQLQQISYNKNTDNNLPYIKHICQYLKAMQVKYVKKHKVNNLEIDICIPDQHIYIMIYTEFNYDIDQQLPNGFALLKRKVLETVKGGYEVIELDYSEFKEQSRNPLSGIEYLMNLGILSNNMSGVYQIN